MQISQKNYQKNICKIYNKRRENKQNKRYKQIKQEKIVVGNIYLIYGDDEYIKNMKIKEIQKKYNVEDSINKIDLNGEEWEEIYDELTLPSF